jgi:phosphoserine phosphatase RsbU/P
MPDRARSFWKRISDGVTLQQLWSELSVEARASYRLYSAEVDWVRLRNEKRSRRAQRVISGLFWAMVMKLSPARRVVLVAALIGLFFFGISFRSPNFEVQIPNLAFLSAILLFGLLALELADRVTMKRDLEIAKEIQTWLMPAAAPHVPGVEIAFATRPANTVAGDYYDTFLRSTTQSESQTCPPLLLIVADVAGKSVPAALLMATLQASLRTLAGICASPVDLVQRLNRYCCEQNIGRKRFTTAFLADFDPQTRQLTYINAGQNWPVLRRASGIVERLETGGIPLGLMPNAQYESAQVSLASGDLLVVFTDGLVEAEDIHEQEYGEPRMFTTLSMCPGASASEVLRNLMTSADQFTGAAPQHDDITCLVMRVLPA